MSIFYLILLIQRNKNKKYGEPDEAPVKKSTSKFTVSPLNKEISDRIRLPSIGGDCL